MMTDSAKINLRIGSELYNKRYDSMMKSRLGPADEFCKELNSFITAVVGLSSLVDTYGSFVKGNLLVSLNQVGDALDEAKRIDESTIKEFE